MVGEIIACAVNSEIVFVDPIPSVVQVLPCLRYISTLISMCPTFWLIKEEAGRGGGKGGKHSSRKQDDQPSFEMLSLWLNWMSLLRLPLGTRWAKASPRFLAAQMMLSSHPNVN